MPLNNIAVTRMPNGLSTRAENTIFGSLPIPDRSLFHIYDQDFDQFVAADWTVTETQAGATQALIAGDGGILSLVNSAADNDVNQVQKLPAAFLPVLGKRLYMKMRFSVSDLVLSDVAIGLINVSADATVLANSVDGIFFLKAEAANSLSVFVRKDNAAGSVTAVVGALIAGINEVAIYYDGGDRVFYALNGVVLGSLAVSAAVFPDAITTVTLGTKNGAAAAITANCDQFLVMQER